MKSVQKRRFTRAGFSRFLEFLELECKFTCTAKITHASLPHADNNIAQKDLFMQSIISKKDEAWLHPSSILVVTSLLSLYNTTIPPRLFMLMNSRNPYIALTPDASLFTIPASINTNELELEASGPSSTTLPYSDKPEDEPVDPSSNHSSCHSWWQWISRRVSGIQHQKLIVNNTGLLLIASAQAFFSCMNVAVKKLNSLDPPVPTLQVSMPMIRFSMMDGTT